MKRNFTSAQLQTALRPFFFLCHPDLFGKFPEQRAINESSLQVLSAHLESLQKSYVNPASPPALPFFLRSKDKSVPFRLVNVSLRKERDTKSFVTNILKRCDLDTSYVEKISIEPTSPKRSNAYNNNNSQFYGTSGKVDEYESPFAEEFIIFQTKVRQAKEDERLENFIKKNIDLALIRTRNLDELRGEVDRLKTELENKLKLKKIAYNCGWNIEHFRGCLKSLEKLYDLYGDDMDHLHGKNLIFSQFTGVSLDGDIHLYTGDVQNNWLDVNKIYDLRY
jgi:hypothetical protein